MRPKIDSWRPCNSSQCIKSTFRQGTNAKYIFLWTLHDYNSCLYFLAIVPGLNPSNINQQWRTHRNNTLSIKMKYWNCGANILGTIFIDSFASVSYRTVWLLPAIHTGTVTNLILRNIYIRFAGFLLCFTISLWPIIYIMFVVFDYE